MCQASRGESTFRLCPRRWLDEKFEEINTVTDDDPGGISPAHVKGRRAVQVRELVPRQAEIRPCWNWRAE